LRALREHLVSTTGGHDIAVNATTICLHSDTPDAVTLAAELRRALGSA
jgi:5-oxoprolinase (ATP-hydrolysing) subunit A